VRTEMDIIGGAPPACRARLSRRSWLCRSLLVSTPWAEYGVDYHGFLFPHLEVRRERAYRGGAWACEDLMLGWFSNPPFESRPSPFAWDRRPFVPTFPFLLEGLPAAIHVRLSPWLALEGFAFRLGEDLLYAEGCFADDGGRRLSGDDALWDRELDAFPSTGRGRGPGHPAARGPGGVRSEDDAGWGEG
jgi:hypothetical protein